MDENENAFASQVDGDDEEGQNGAVDPGYSDEAEANAESHEQAEQEDPYGIKKRLGMQAKKHAREMRQMQEQMLNMQTQFQRGNMDSANPSNHSYNQDYSSPGQPNQPPMSEEEKIHRAVRFALGAKEHEEKQAKEAEHASHVHKEYKRLHDEFDRASEKYDDFDDVVRGDDVPFTPHVRDALLLVENPAEVAYKLGKNKSELERISKLHPLAQAREVNKLSHALMVGKDEKSSNTTKSNPLGAVRANPAHSSTAVTDKTPPSAIRARMKAGTWK